MKKSFMLLSVLFAIASCRNFEEQTVRTVERADIQEEETYGISLKASIASDSTKTSLDSNGYTVNWNTGDKFSLLVHRGSSDQLIKMTLKSGAGTSEATFTGETYYKYWNPVIALYPFVSSLTQSNYETFYMSLPSSTEQEWSTLNLGGDDIKAGCSFTGNLGDGMTVKFKELGTLLDFIITPTAEMAAANDKLNSFTFTAGTSYISGKYAISLNDGDPIISVPGTSNFKSRTISYTGSVPTFSAGNTTELLMMILPGITQNETLRIDISTDNYLISVNAKAAKTYQSGYKYRMELDLPSLVASSKATVTLRDDFIKTTDCYGVFNISDPSNIKSTYADDVEGWQSGCTSSCFRLQNWNNGELIKFTLPDAMTVGSICSISVSSLKGTIPSGTISARLVSTDGKIYWFKSEDGKTGYIIPKL